MQGQALANDSAASPISRAKADRLLQDFLGRVEAVNRNPAFAYRVRTVAVFGSYLSPVESLSDLDVAIALTFREADRTRQEALMNARIDLALASGRRFQNVFEQLWWPRREVVLFLKARTRGLSLHDYDEEARLLKELRIVFEE